MTITDNFHLAAPVFAGKGISVIECYYVILTIIVAFCNFDVLCVVFASCAGEE